MKDSLRQSMALFHTWSGLLLGWLLFAMFATGTAAYFQDEITRWMQPEVTGDADPAIAAQGAMRYLNTVAPDAKSWYISLPNSRSATTQVYWQPSGERPAKRSETSALLDRDGRAITTRETRGGFFLYRFHFDLHYMPVLWARYLVGVAAMFMLVAILSGVITHKKIFADFFMLRFGKGQRSWLDAHNVTAVLALPFHLMITFTGLVTLASMYMPWGIAANYAAPAAFSEAVFGRTAEVEASGRHAALVDLAPLVRRASAQWHGERVGYISIANPNDAAARIDMNRAAEAPFGARGQTASFEGATGRPIGSHRAAGAALATESVMIGLHTGRFAKWGLRWLYFLSGLGGTVMVGSGLVLWTVKRRARLPDPSRPHMGFRIVERLNIAAIAGLATGIAAYFLANRLLPLEMADRAEHEIDSLFLAWFGVGLWGMLRPAGRAWTETLAMAGACFVAIPLVNALTTSRGLLPSLLAGDWTFAAFDLVMLLLAAGFLLAAVKSARARAKATLGRKPRATSRQATSA
ncbi:PepSY-associated TM helix domain-containing protein [Novosphingobium resinovorum]|uniref:PepSY-associated TM helix domain-containing protein n=1 Tax=Novosphingobium resinovorum TaxID=158500 RepID=A0A031JUI2_9SPHN|nr:MULTISPECIES: PepSY-associated TM helix domain-containing protein [Novosphingobium]EZP80610.1 PepSY-associated TM helix domain-containing protein [Novosphingobium resinovorum]MBF7013631.1 PepSY domain-containing protein [Novosphingobium sp. HR1a]WJM25780.1 PepSY-associated TM helix domain-containing protein [Novosphingobium resinovorum]